jgi:hypothetical protein
VARRCDTVTPFTAAVPSLTKPAGGDRTLSSVRGSGMLSGRPVPGAPMRIHPENCTPFDVITKPGKWYSCPFTTRMIVYPVLAMPRAVCQTWAGWPRFMTSFQLDPSNEIC